MDGVNPEASLTDVDGVLYGTTIGGGSGCYPSGGCGTVFSLTTSGGESVLHSFTGGEDGALPYAPLTYAGGLLFGTTGGGASTGGTAFSITTSGTETVLHDFGGASDGADPHAALLDVDGTLYGTTVYGGSMRRGTVFKIATSSGGETVIHSFLGTKQHARDGKFPDASLLNVNGTLYGTTYKGGLVDHGTVYEITPSGKEVILHSFLGGGRDGSYPRAGLVYVNGSFYGTTSGGGNFGCKGCGKNPGFGTIVEVSPFGVERVIYKFQGYPTDGAFPYGELLYDNGVFYGTTESGGAKCAISHGCGTIFSVTPAGSESVLYSFDARDGSFPVAGLTDVNGTLYGTTPTGGTHNRGTVFSLSGYREDGAK